MRSLQKILVMIVFVGLVSLVVGNAMAVCVPSYNIVFDENGNGTLNGQPLPWNVGPGPFGTNQGPDTLYYSFPFNVAEGQYNILEPGTSDISDVLRFVNVNQGGLDNSRVYVYSDIGDSDKADVGLPGDWSTSIVTLQEVGPEDNNGVTFTATSNTPGAPGFTGFANYQFISDVPEPSTLVLLGIGVIGFVAYGWRKHRIV
jgi:hypothetical protein